MVLILPILKEVMVAGEGLESGITNQNIKDWNDLYNYDWLTKTENLTKTDGQKLNAHIGKGFSIGDGTLYLSAQYRNQGRTNRLDWITDSIILKILMVHPVPKKLHLIGPTTGDTVTLNSESSVYLPTVIKL
jgi:hypothetical protein